MGAWLLVGKYLFLGLLFVFLVALYRAMVGDAMRGVRARPRERRAARRARRERRPALEPAPAEPVPGALTAEPATPRPAARVVAEPPPAPPEPLEPTAAAPPTAGPPERTAQPCLVVVRSPDEERLALGSVVTLSAATTVGRGQENSVVLPDRYASLHHALIYVADNRRVLRDRGSTNGTILNGSRIRTEMPLRDGDRIEIGTTVLEYHQ